jgi:predicted PhzF superfamily epimerase YddE/YHI9
VGRDGRIEIALDAAGDIWVGGACVTTVSGVLQD